LAAVALDSPDPQTLARFYRDILDAEIIWESDDFVALKAGKIALTVQRIADYQTPTWPENSIPKQMHLELQVDDLDSAQTAVLAAGGRKAETQPSPERWRVLIDPAGHPFCLTTMVPEF
jgi:catechol 2,3-dioxygenase-like lactoylglutathione lyase family enzyme